jgi:hypothetical protein
MSQKSSLPQVIQFVSEALMPDTLAETSKSPASSIAFIKDRSGWVIGLCLGLLAVLTGLLAFQTEDSGFRLAMLAFTVFGAAMAAAESGRRLAHMRRIATG